ncbi:MAG: zinc ribbon-containing protein [Pseudomonadota bacterium]
MTDPENSTPDKPNQEKPNPVARLTEAYSVMLERANEFIDAAEEQAKPAFEHAVERARETAEELGELSRDEAHRVAEFLKRDVRDAGRHLAESRHELADWFRFDVEQLESRLLDAFARAADRTSLELMELADRARHAQGYHSGEITGPGTLMCNDCGELLHFDKPRAIPSCPKCGGKLFRRADEG